MGKLSFVIYIIELAFVITGSNAEFYAPATCGCCPSPWCSTRVSPCSSNGDCECLLMTMTGAGVCADTILSCSHLSRCQNDNVTCLEPNTVCVNNTRCEVPVCYPIARASSELCPPFVSRYSSPTPSTISTTTTPITESPTTTTPIPESSTTTTETTTSTTESSTTTTPIAESSTTTTETATTTTESSTTTTINACLNGTKCLNNGTCQPSGTTFFCLCAPSYYGTRCEYRGAGTDLSILEGILNGSITNYDRSVENILNRTNWTNILAVVDVTGSMQPCAAAVYKWMKLAYEKLNRITYYVFFNDGDSKADSSKVIGSTGGVYGIGTTDLYTVLAAMQTAMKNGNGGDGPENDIEALLYGIRQCPTCTNVVHIADNQVTPRDMILLSSVSIPVKVITCQLNSGIVNPDLINIAAKTNGSIHTLEQDIINLSDIPIGGTVLIGTHTYQRTATGYRFVS